MSTWGIIWIATIYLGILFLLAHFVEKKAKKRKFKSKWIYALAIPVYCTAWTYYGSVGKAVNDGWEFLAIYLGPILTIPLWWIVVRKIIRICSIQRISTLPDFISSRYDKSMTLSVLSSVFIVLGIIPYISIQLKSITSSFNILTGQVYESPEKSFFFNDNAFYLSVILAAFIIIFVFRSLETTEKHHGLMAAIAVDSVVKLIAFLAVGVYVTFFLFDGFGDVFSKASGQFITKFESIDPATSLEWLALLGLSMSAIVLLPRQFQVIVAENENEDDIKTAAWVLPLYLLLINIFVVPIALAGKFSLPSAIDPDSYVLVLPMVNHQTALAGFTFLGGFSASTGMIIVSTIALSMILSNNVLVPLTLKKVENKNFYAFVPLKSRRIAVYVILFLAYLYYKFISDRFPLVSIGLISFAAMIQFLPLVIGALFWRNGNKHGATWGLIGGFMVWAYTLVLPTLVVAGILPESIQTHGPFGLHWLRPESLLGMQLSPIAHGTMWSLLVNCFLYFFGSVLKEQTPKERNLAEFYFDIYDYSSKSEERLVWKGNLPFHELLNVCKNLLGEERTREILDHYNHFYDDPEKENGQADPRFVNHIERILSGAVGSSSARLIISSLANEEEVELKDVVQLLKDTSEISKLNKELRATSQDLISRTAELIEANERLQNMDEEKDDFISTVTHELRTPLTSIKAFIEIIQDNPDIEQTQRDKFLTNMNNEIDRMSRLINQVLDMEKLESGTLSLAMEKVSPYQIIEDSLLTMNHLFQTKNIKIEKDLENIKNVVIQGERDRLKQVFVNILSNSTKYIDSKNGVISLYGKVEKDNIILSIKDNGRGIKKENIDRIFEKFFQARDQTRKKPKGSGLGLSITKRILDLHHGEIKVESQFGSGATFIISLPTGNASQKVKTITIATEV